MPSAEFEAAIATIERLLTHALDHTATRTDDCKNNMSLLNNGGGTQKKGFKRKKCKLGLCNMCLWGAFKLVQILSEWKLVLTAREAAGNNGRGTVHESNTERSLTSFDKRHPQKAFPCLFVPGRVAKQPQRGTNCKG